MSKKQFGNVTAEIKDVVIKDGKPIVSVKFTEASLSWFKGFLIVGRGMSAEKFWHFIEQQDIYPPKEDTKLLEDLRANIGVPRKIKPVGEAQLIDSQQ